jgi:hypothetical protein
LELYLFLLVFDFLSNFYQYVMNQSLGSRP